MTSLFGWSPSSTHPPSIQGKPSSPFNLFSSSLHLPWKQGYAGFYVDLVTTKWGIIGNVGSCLHSSTTFSGGGSGPLLRSTYTSHLTTHGQADEHICDTRNSYGPPSVDLKTTCHDNPPWSVSMDPRQVRMSALSAHAGMLIVLKIWQLVGASFISSRQCIIHANKMISLWTDVGVEVHQCMEFVLALHLATRRAPIHELVAVTMIVKDSFSYLPLHLCLTGQLLAQYSLGNRLIYFVGNSQTKL